MKTVYIKKDKVIKYFIFGISENKENSCENIYFTDIETIESKAFQKWSNVKNIFWDEKLKTIENEAFKDCSGLEVFCCGSSQAPFGVALKLLDSVRAYCVYFTVVAERGCKSGFVIKNRNGFRLFSVCENDIFGNYRRIFYRK